MLSISKIFTSSIKLIFFPVFLAITFCSFSIAGQTQKTEETQPKSIKTDVAILKLNQPIERQIKGGETHFFQFNVKAGEYARAEVEQKNIDVVVSLFTPDGKLVVEMDGKNGFLWREVVSCIADKDGVYRVEVKAYGAGDSAGNYAIKLADLRPALAKDRQHIEAEQHLNAGRKLFEQGGAQYEAAIIEYETTAKLWRELGETESEAIVLTNLGFTFYSLSNYDQTIASLTRAAKLFQETKDRLGESKAVNILGGAYYYLGQYEKALDYYAIALAIKREIKDRRGEGVILIRLGDVYRTLGESDKSEEYLKQALMISREIKKRLDESDALNSLGILYLNLGQYGKAAEYFEQVLPITREFKSRFNESQILNNLGSLYSYLKQYEKSNNFYEQALIVKRELNDQSGAAGILFNLGNNYYFRLNDYEKARGYFEQMLKIKQEFQEPSDESYALNGLGNVFNELKQYEKAAEYYERALAIRQKIKDKSGEMTTLNSIGTLLDNLGQREKARQRFEQALAIAKEIKDKSSQGDICGNLLITLEELNNSRLAIFYGKQSVNAYQEIRGNIKNLDKESQQSFLKSVEGTYRKLADVLIAEGRLLEAQAVLALLKEEEYEQLKRSGETADTVPYSKVESDVIAKIENLVALERERAELQKLPTRTTEQEDKLEQLRTDIAAANKAFDVALDALGKTEASVTTRVDEIKGGQEIQSALTALGKETKSGVVALYTVLGTDKKKDETGKTKNVKSKFGWVIMVTEKGYKAYPIDVTNLEETVFAFRNALSSDKYDPQPLAEKIYTAIFRQTSAKQKRTLESDLREYLGSHKDKTLMWSLDGVLRYIPMAALHDGKGYLVENYRNVVFTKQSFLWLTKENQTGWNALGLGVSEKRENFDALPGVKTELETIVREPNKPTGIMNGSIKLNENFKEQTFFNTVGAGAFPVVHIASHYSFNPSQQDASFLLVGDGRLTFSEMKAEKNLFGAVDLLTLSACDTGVSGNGKEAEGFAYLAQSLGAKSVIASLWKVSDAGTPELMIRFYKLRTENPNISKGEAFRQAQLSLLNIETGKAKTSDARRSEIVTLGGKKGELPLYEKIGKPPFAHPHYWSSFILIGNWR